MQEDIVKDKRKKIRDDFLDNFFIPLRREFEENLDQYKTLFPIKEGDMAEKTETQQNIYQYLEEVSSRKLDIHTEWVSKFVLSCLSSLQGRNRFEVDPIIIIIY